MRRFFVALFVIAGIASLGALGAPLVACSSCAAECQPLEVPLLRTTGYQVTGVTSSCNNGYAAVPGNQVFATALDKPATCHFEVTLDDGETIGFDVPFTKDGKSCCCGDCVTVKTTDFAPLAIDAPPGYVPASDAGADDGAPE